MSFEPLKGVSSHDKPIRTGDGWISFTVNTDPQVQAFLKVTDRHHLLECTALFTCDH
jgi:hypothetical protein